MKIRAKQQDLVSAISGALLGRIEFKQHVWLETSQDGAIVTGTIPRPKDWDGTKSDQYVATVNLDCEVIEPGRVNLNIAGRLLELLGAYHKDDDVEIEFVSKHTFEVRSCGFNQIYRHPLQNRKLYVRNLSRRTKSSFELDDSVVADLRKCPKHFTNTISIPSRILLDGLRLASLADQIKYDPRYGRLLIHAKDKELTFVCGDGFHFGVWRYPLDRKVKEQQFIISAWEVHRWRKLFKHSDTVTIQAIRKTALISSDDRSLLCPSSDEQFLSYEQYTHPKHNCYLRLDREDFVDAIKVIHRNNNEELLQGGCNAIRCSMDEELLVLESAAITMTVDANNRGVDQMPEFGSLLVYNCLRLCSGKYVDWFINPNGAIHHIRPVNDDSQVFFLSSCDDDV